jgi:DNA-binding transcriptional LysR family regulator
LETDWLEDFLSVVECGGFSRAAEVRHITQSALSRRIRALEDWVGTPLFYRTTHSVTLSPAGESFRQSADDTLRRLTAARADALERASGVSERLRFASTNALSLTFFPSWLRRLEHDLPSLTNVQLVANHMRACERMMLQGEVQFLLCHHHPRVRTALDPSQFRSVRVGDDVLLPLSAPAPGGGVPLHRLPGSAEAPVACLSYRPESLLGRIVAEVGASSPVKPSLKDAFSADGAKLLVTMALDQRGMAWLPRSVIEDELASGRLVRAGGEEWDIPIEIHVFRPNARLTRTAEELWALVER